MLLLGPIAFGLALLMSMNMAIRKIKPPRVRLISDIKTFEAFLLSEKAPQLSKVKVMGNFSSVTDDHPVVEAVISRWRANSKPGQRHHGDVKKIALSIEGGGMRGCVSAGATAALNILGLDNTIDVVYGSSAGAMIAAFFISRQVSGVQIYHDILPIAGKRFIDKGKLLFAAGLPGWLNIFLRTNTGTVDEIMSFIPDPEALEMKHSKMINSRRLSNVFNLDFLLVQVMGVLQPLDWEIFTKNEASQPLRIVASSLKTLTPLVMSRENKNYGDMPSLLSCIRASMSVPGITGNLMALSENNRKKNFFPLGHALSVPFSVHTRKKVEHSYETSKVTNVDLTVESAVTNETNMKMKVTESKTMKSKILQQFIAIAASALAILLQLIRQLRGDVSQKYMSEKNSAANEIYGIKENSDNISQQKRNNDIIHKSNEGTQESTIKSTLEKSRGDDKINKKSVRISVEDCEPIVDAFLCEPLPYRSAVQEGASHVIVLRTRPDPCPVLGKGPGVFEKLIAKRFFKSYKERGASEYMMALEHHRIYAQDVLRLSEGSKGPKEGVNVDGKYVHLLSIAPSADRVEVGQLEMRRDKVLTGMQDGARRVFEIFGPSTIGPITSSDIEDLVQSILPDTMLLRKPSLQDFEKTLVVQDGLDNQL